jgi:tryptophan synthase beta subunit
MSGEQILIVNLSGRGDKDVDIVKEHRARKNGESH